MTTNATQTVRIVPANTRVVLQDRNGAHRWFTTTKDVTVPEQPATRVCPARNVSTCYFEQGGYGMFFRDDQMEYRFGDDARKAFENRKWMLLNYDVREGTDLSEFGVSNAHDYLISRAVWRSGSAWLIEESMVPWELGNRIIEAGGIWDVDPFDPSATIKLMNQAIASIRTQIRQQEERNLESQAAADRKYTEAVNDVVNSDPNEAQKDYLKRIQAIQSRTAKKIAAFAEIADKIGISRFINLMGAQASADAHRDAMRERARTFAEAAAALRAGNAEQQAVAASLSAGEMPADIAADFLDDQDYGSGKALREAFTDTHTPGV